MTISLTEAIGNPVSITTGAVTFQANPLVQSYSITTGGTAGIEVINLPFPTLPQDSYANGNMVGRRITFFIAVRTNVADVVRINVNGVGVVNVRVPNIGLQSVINGVILNSVGHVASFLWINENFILDQSITNSNDATPISPLSFSIQLPQKTIGGAAPNINIEASSTSFTNAAGGNVNIYGGSSTTSGTGGNIVLAAGTGVTAGQVVVNSFMNCQGGFVTGGWDFVGVSTGIEWNDSGLKGGLTYEPSENAIYGDSWKGWTFNATGPNTIKFSIDYGAVVTISGTGMVVAGTVTGSNLSGTNTGNETSGTITSKLSAAGINYVQSNTTGITGADQITNIVSLTQAEYDAIVSPSATTLYVIVT